MQYVAPAVLVVAPLIATLIERAIRGRDA
jgi:hypothetical protein